MPSFLISDECKCLTALFMEKNLQVSGINHFLVLHTTLNLMGRLSVLTTLLPIFNPILDRYANTYHTNWDKYVSYVDFAYTISHHETFRMTTIFVLYG